jgi:hypothetical protein
MDLLKDLGKVGTRKIVIPKKAKIAIIKTTNG